ncbi:TPA: hypothetical protein TZE22_001072 [Streptococcus suis]|nr:hypothetical protein [Streptococcus suis]HEM4972389.1 hypothetical protein [Streptococcus suis]HEM5158606.1 hypothetical protein [Streptococcus suis]HEM5323010.1 hypothetical protein [Streptococcus suis]HEM5336430.1 hypothetical protein [Streptococcus suis]
MKDRANDILVDYEWLCGQLTDICEVLDLITVGHGQTTTSAIINTVLQALEKTIADHKELTNRYREDLKHD